MKNKAPRKTLKVCSRGHEFCKSSECPICPKCWSGYYKDKNLSDFPKGLSAPAIRALLNAKITNLKEVSKQAEKDLLKLHGFGPSGLKMLHASLKERGLSLNKL